jgi:DNA-binding GntR family transcriptional regulator
MPQNVLTGTSRRTLRSQLVNKILTAIFSGEVHGGDRLVEEELAARLGVSRTPIRESLGELAAIGVIQLKPNHGAMVRPFGPEQLREIYHVRRILEVEATRLAALSIDSSALQEIRERTQELLNKSTRGRTWSELALELDQRLHELISRSSGSERLAEEIGKYRNLVVAVGNAVGNTLHAHDQNLSEHTAIIDHLLAQRGAEAAEAMGRHIDRGAETAAEAFSLIYAQKNAEDSAANRTVAPRPSSSTRLPA